MIEKKTYPQIPSALLEQDFLSDKQTPRTTKQSVTALFIVRYYSLVSRYSVILLVGILLSPIPALTEATNGGKMHV